MNFIHLKALSEVEVDFFYESINTGKRIQIPSKDMKVNVAYERMQELNDKVRIHLGNLARATSQE